MDTKYYLLLGGILVVVVVGFLLWQQSIVEKNSINNENLGVMENQPTEQEELKIEVLQQGEGQEAKNGDEVFVHYTGYLTNGQVFDSSIGRGEPFSFILGAGRVIKGWEQGILGMKIGEKRRLTIPSDLAYGQQGVQDPASGTYIIPPNAVLVFEVELLTIGQ